MLLLEKIAHSIRHSKVGKGLRRLWDLVRPLYNFVILLIGRNGLKRVINHSDEILVLPSYRGISEGYEKETWQQLMSSLKKGDIVVDVGAYVGLYALAIAKRIGGEGRVYAFEPDPANYKDLCKHVALNGLQSRIESVNMVVGDEMGDVTFSARGNVESSVDPLGNGALMKQIRLDSFFSGNVDVMKIDVEGYEEKVLKGASGLLTDPKKNPRAIFIEIHRFAWDKFGTTWDSLLSLVPDHYRVEEISGRPLSTISSWGEIVCHKRVD